MPQKADIAAILKRYWGYDSFRLQQEEIIRSVLDGYDTIGLLPTGGGKSLTYHVAGLALGGLTVIVTPLISLMTDQVENLKRHNLRATVLHSGLSSEERESRLEALRNGIYPFLYLSPERLQKKTFTEQLRTLPVRLIAVDEAHCISQWGHEFRPSYRRIAAIREYFPTVPVLAVTATATPQVIQDIAQNLELQSPVVRVSTFARPGLQYAVQNEPEPERRLLHVLNHLEGSAIVYVRERMRTEFVAHYLVEKGISAAAYNAGLPSAVRKNRQEDWMQGKVRVMVATNAFGMGIHNDNVRLVCHLSLPPSLEEYYQEAGRAGRDGNGALALLLYRSSEIEAAWKHIRAKRFDRATVTNFFQTLYTYCAYQKSIPGTEYFAVYLASLAERWGGTESQTRALLELLHRAEIVAYRVPPSHEVSVLLLADHPTVERLSKQNRDTERILAYIHEHYPEVHRTYVILPLYRMVRALNLSEATILATFNMLHQKGYAELYDLAGAYYLRFLQSEAAEGILHFDFEHWESVQKAEEDRFRAMVGYVQNSEGCREQMLRRYFGEEVSDVAPCQRCDFCLKK